MFTVEVVVFKQCFSVWNMDLVVVDSIVVHKIWHFIIKMC